MGRAIPRSIRKNLRKEVGFGCPVDDCRIPFLEYHHFDPPYHEAKEHNEEGIIALCPTHHNMADNGAWSVDDLHEMKRKKSNKPPIAKLGWSIDEGVVVSGSNFFFTPSLTLRMEGKELFRLKQDNKGKILVNALLWNNNKEIVAEIKNNDMIVNDIRLEDMDCMASGKEIFFKAPDDSNYVKIRFERKPIDNFIDNAEKMADPSIIESLIKELISRERAGMINVISFDATVKESDFIFKADKKQIAFDFSKVGLGIGEHFGTMHGRNSSLTLTKKNGRELIYLGK